MKIKKLIQKLSSLDPNMEVIISSDSEGNSYSKLDGFVISRYLKNDEYLIELVDFEEQDILAETDPVKLKQYPECVVLYP